MTDKLEANRAIGPRRRGLRPSAPRRVHSEPWRVDRSAALGRDGPSRRPVQGSHRF